MSDISDQLRASVKLVLLRKSQAVPRHDALAQTAERLYPGNVYLQDEWRRAVAVVRSTRSGWLMDQKVARR